MSQMSQPATRLEPTTATAAVAAVYQAFGAGDVPALLALLADDVAFDADRVPSDATRARHPLLRARRGKSEVSEFFAELGRCAVQRFVVRDLLAGGDGQVAAVIEIELGYPGGGTVHDQEIHLWRVGEDGLVRTMSHFADTAAHLGALSG